MTEKKDKKIFGFKQSGFGMIEIMVVVTVGVALFLGIEQYLNISLAYAEMDKNKTEALYRAEALLEESRAVRDEGWTNISGLTPGNPYHFSTTGAAPAKWIVQTGQITDGKYTMGITPASVYRDINKNIVASGGTLDINTLKITSSISWVERGTAKQVSLSEYLANFK